MLFILNQMFPGVLESKYEIERKFLIFLGSHGNSRRLDRYFEEAVLNVAKYPPQSYARII